MFDVEAVPLFLRERAQWIVWWEKKGNDGSTDKVPVSRSYIRSARKWASTRKASWHELPGDSNDAANRSAFAQALDDATYATERLALPFGIGYALSGDDQVLVFDFDDVVKGGRVVDDEVAKFLAALGTYVELSPSGNGLHAYCAISPMLKERIKTRTGQKKKFAVGRPHDLFVSGLYVTVTGIPLRPHCKAFNADADDIVQRWFVQRFPGQQARDASASSNHDASDDLSWTRAPHQMDLDDGGVRERVAELLDRIDADCSRDDWIKVGMVLHKITQGDHRGLELWRTWSYRAPDRVPKQSEPSFERLYKSFDADTLKGVGFGSLVHLARDTTDHEQYERAGKQLARAIADAKTSLAALAEKRGVTLQAAIAKKGLDIVSVSDLKPEATRWLWTNVIPFGHLTMLSGEVGSNKSTLLLKLAADTTHTKKLEYDQHERAYQQRVERVLGDTPEARPYKRSGLVYYLTSEMHWTQTVAPMLHAMDAKRDRVKLIRSTYEETKRSGTLSKRPFNFVHDMGVLVRSFVELRTIPDLIILDPLSSFIGQGVDRNAESDVRTILEMLADLCNALGIALVCVVHQSKNVELKGVNKVHGSVAFSAVARVVTMVEKVNAPASMRQGWEVASSAFALHVIKSNISPTRTEAYVFVADDDKKTMGRTVTFVECAEWPRYMDEYISAPRDVSEDEKAKFDEQAKRARIPNMRKTIEGVLLKLAAEPTHKHAGLMELCRDVAAELGVSHEYVRQVLATILFYDKTTGWTRRQ